MASKALLSAALFGISGVEHASARYLAEGEQNVKGGPLQQCDPATPNGTCSEHGTHLVCGNINDEIRKFMKSKGNDLDSTKGATNWCYCTHWYKTANDRKPGMITVIPEATNKRALKTGDGNGTALPELANL
jgi:uncharacterized protein (DUF2237 family)